MDIKIWTDDNEVTVVFKRDGAEVSRSTAATLEDAVANAVNYFIDMQREAIAKLKTLGLITDADEPKKELPS